VFFITSGEGDNGLAEFTVALPVLTGIMGAFGLLTADFMSSGETMLFIY